MERRPRILGSFVQGTLEAIDRRDPDLGRRVRERMRSETRQAIAGASRIAFVPVDLDAELTECLFEIAGPERAREIFRRNLADTLNSPLFRSFMSMALRLRGRRPGRLLDWCSKVWNQIYRDAGDMRFVALGEREGRIELSGLPPVLTRDPRYVDGIAATVSAIFDILEMDGGAELKALDPASGRAIISVAWDPGD